jgi:hypothetical protein
MNHIRSYDDDEMNEYGFGETQQRQHQQPTTTTTEDTASAPTTIDINNNNSTTFNADDDEPRSLIYDIIHEYYQHLLKKLKNHMMLEDVIRDELALTTFYNDMYRALDEKVRQCPPNQQEYDNLIRQAKFHLKKMYNQGMCDHIVCVK